MVTVRLEALDDVLKDTPPLSLPIVFVGSFESAVEWAEAQDRYVKRDSRKEKYGFFFYNKVEAKCLLLT